MCLKMKYGMEAQFSNVSLGLFKPNNQLMFSFVICLVQAQKKGSLVSGNHWVKITHPPA